ncbi:hypothetical protein ACPVPU_14395 [Sphingomonas sp. CJ99]
MKSMTKISQFRVVVKIIDGQRRLLSEAGADAELISSFDAIVRHLHRLPESQVYRIIEGARPSGEDRAKREKIEAASRLSLSHVEAAVDNNELTRSDLEAIAIGRFQVPRGSMRSIGNIENLRDKIRTLVQNERAHATITKVARETKK